MITCGQRAGRGRRTKIHQQVDDDVDRRDHRGDPHDCRKIQADGTAKRVAPEPGPGEDRFGQHGAGQQLGIGQPAQGHHGQQSVRQGVTQGYGAPHEALRPSDPDIVLRQCLQHRRAGGAGDQAHGAGGQHDRRQHQMSQRVLKRVPVAGQRRIDQHDAGDLRWRERVGADLTWSRCPFQRAIEHRQHDEREPEGGRGYPDQRYRTRQVVDPAVAAHRGQYAQRQTDRDR